MSSAAATTTTKVENGHRWRVPLGFVLAAAILALLAAVGGGSEAEAQTGSDSIACVALVGVFPIDADLDGELDTCATCAENSFHYELVDETGDGVPNSCFEVSLCNGMEVTIWGSPGDDVLQGTSGADVIHLLSGDDTVSGFGGNDVICGGNGRDRIYGGDGADTIFGGPAIDYVWGGGDGDQLYGEGGSDRLKGGAGTDLIEGGSGADRLWGQGEGDTLLGQGGQDQMWGGNGNDTMVGNWQSDQMWGGLGSDTMSGNGGKDRMFGESGHDTMNGGDNVDTLEGGAGDDSLLGGNGADTLRGGSGIDVLNGQRHADVCEDDPSTTTFVSCATTMGPSGQSLSVQVVAPSSPDPTLRPFTDFEVFVTDITYTTVTIAVAELGGNPPVSVGGASCAQLLIDFPQALSCTENDSQQLNYGTERSVGFLDADGRISIPASNGTILVHSETTFLGDPYCWWTFNEIVEPGVTSVVADMAALCA